jgi:Cytochrome C oxidase, cbb3-type, subunit III
MFANPLSVTMPPANTLEGETMRLDGKALFFKQAVAGFVILILGAFVTADVALGADPEPGTYKVIDGKVDRDTYQGWRVFHSVCHICHGKGAVGTDIAPSLLPRMESLTPSEFAERVLVRYRLFAPGDARAAVNPTPDRQAVIAEVMAKKRGPKGRIDMPAWEKDAAINAHILDLYAYLLARSDRMIGAEEPGVLPAE